MDKVVRTNTSMNSVFYTARDRAERLDNLSRPGKELYRDDVPPLLIHEASVRSAKYVPGVFCLGWICAVAVVYDTAHAQRVKAIGTQAGIELFAECADKLAAASAKRYKPYDHYYEGARCVGKAIPRSTWQGRMHRMRLLDVQHRVCEVAPALRVWREGGRQPWQDEVWLHRAHGGHHAGGCLWIREYYTTGQCLEDMGWQTKDA